MTNYDPMASLAQFHQAVSEVPFVDRDAKGRLDLLNSRMRLIREEFLEVTDELLDGVKGVDGGYARLCKELADLLYVVYGTAQLFEVPIYDVFREVHRSNMSKLDNEGKPVRDRNGKVLKGANYQPADIDRVLGNE